ncbi:PilZ domain-containing protein [Thalassotalea piscium]|uniref:C-di-GMP-binding flagellar brake protein YcgR n=1 Tax=Thalassotalea piscium TaxID=1230533 RepID=A0A7X0NJA7_9GAMM|nr:PilZ domain-containing protein [Thalassotalea piscium]MBB6544460.1 c-di-GMP-binding flagellar brake protein YcgR [Thalassotalea piscium]
MSGQLKAQIEITDVFELLPGKILDVQLNHPLQVRLKLPLIGYVMGQYIILKYPSVVKDTDYEDVLKEGNVAIVRYLLEGDQGKCFAFRATIRNVTKRPDKFLILNYPKRIENRQLRLHQRVMTHLPAAISVTENDESTSQIQGMIVDISLKGCGFTFKAPNETVSVNKRDVVVLIKYANDEQIKIPAKVCNSRNEKGKVSVGIQFAEGDKQVEALLENLFIDTSMI